MLIIRENDKKLECLRIIRRVYLGLYWPIWAGLYLFQSKK